MRGELKETEYDKGYSTAKGLFFTDSETYYVEVYAGKGEELSVKLFAEEEENHADTVCNQLKIHGAGVNESLSMSSKQAKLPKTDEELEAFARYALQDHVEEGLRYDGPRELEDLKY